jgi:hypothetical protein
MRWVILALILCIAFVAGLLVGYAAGEEDWLNREQRKNRRNVNR